MPSTKMVAVHRVIRHRPSGDGEQLSESKTIAERKVDV